jgi:hypothetical protein
MCYYEMTRTYKKEYKRSKGKKSSEEACIVDGNDIDEGDDCHGDELHFTVDHPGRSFSHLRKRKLKVIPKMSLPKGKLCRLEELELSSSRPSQVAMEKREDYAKMALLMFYPFRRLEDLLLDGSYWKLFDRERRNRTKFWEKGFNILQNIQDRMTLEKKMTRARDPILKEGIPPQVGDTTSPTKKRGDDDSVIDISEFCKGDESDEENAGETCGLGEVRHDLLRSHSHLIDQSNFGKDHIIGARLSSTESLFHQDNDESTSSRPGNRNSSNLRVASYPMLLKMIAGSMVGDSEYDVIYQDYDKEDDPGKSSCKHIEL